ncbi:hypothetical protein LZ578_09890 [Jeotgalibaca sp. MA1X17-3]|uniref:sunset domain-containing protein n=1 Tax=Jeotgalibaca sp. MA1X17-3 TaxID=2908211 RepID=UPI001F393549|nr:hypothetical protein [Jeotgalibaca sp. MA1X17-3]UJF15273.1 hypothetical protein LZ578_09890 [Jeotgalibaca sp. MA1X17-3]
MKKIIKNISLLGIIFSFFFLNSSVALANENVTVQYRTHVEKQGWQNFVTNSETSGTSNQALRLEAIEINIPNTSNGGIAYQTHIQSIGWQDFKSDGQMSGTEGQAKRLEAIKIELTGDLAYTHDIYYQVHAEKFGWLDWAMNGEPAGSAGYAYRLEAIRIEIVPKGYPAPGSTDRPYMEYVKPQVPMKVNYTTHIQSYGWQKPVSNGAMSGTEGQAKRLEGIKINISNPEMIGGVTYRTHVQSYGWQGWVSNNQVSGTQGQAKRLEAIEIKLTDRLAEFYDIHYRVHAQTFGWMGWAKNGEPAGTSAFGFRLEGIEIKLVPKGNNPPGTTLNAYRDGNRLYVDKKGNGTIKGSNSGIYHIPGSQHYNQTTNPRAWFKTELEAMKAKYRPARIN